MAWIMVGTAVGGAALGAYSGGQKADQQNRQRNADIEASRYTPWTQVEYKPQAVTASAMDGGIQGGVSGLNFGQKLGGAAKPATGVAGANAMAGGPMDNLGAQSGSIYEQMKPGYERMKPGQLNFMQT